MAKPEATDSGTVSSAESTVTQPQRVDLPPAGDMETLKSSLKVIEHCVGWLEKIPAGEWRDWAIRSIVATLASKKPVSDNSVPQSGIVHQSTTA